MVLIAHLCIRVALLYRHPLSQHGYLNRSDTGALGADEASALATSSSIFFLVLVVSQLGHVLSIRKRIPYFAGLATARSWSEVTAVIRKGIGIRWPIVGGWVVSIIAINIFNEIPG